MRIAYRTSGFDRELSDLYHAAGGEVSWTTRSSQAKLPGRKTWRGLTISLMETALTRRFSAVPPVNGSDARPSVTVGFLHSGFIRQTNPNLIEIATLFADSYQGATQISLSDPLRLLHDWRPWVTELVLALALALALMLALAA